MGPPPGREKTEKPSSKKVVDVKTPEEPMEAHKQKMKQELLEAKEAKRRRREKEEKETHCQSPTVRRKKSSKKILQKHLELSS